MKPQEAAPKAAEFTANLYRIAVIPGDGIGPEVIRQGCEVLEATARHYDLTPVFEELPWGSDYYKRHGRMMPDDAVDLLQTKTRSPTGPASVISGAAQIRASRRISRPWRCRRLPGADASRGRPH